MKRKIFPYFLFLFIVVSNTIKAQVSYDLPKIIPPSPAAQNFLRYGEIPVDYSTGVPSISVPLYTLGSRKLQLPMSISYHAAGIKVNDYSSVVGLGWVLNAGGIVTVNYMGGSDNGYPLSYRTADSLNNRKVALQSDWQALRAFGDSVRLNSEYGKWQSDRYSFQLPNGESGIFRYDFVTGQIIKIPATSVKIEKIVSSGLVIGFKITDQSGTVYNFELSEEGYYSGMNRSTWDISSIISADKTDTIRFVYKSGQYSRNVYSTYSYTSVLDYGTTPTDHQSVFIQYDADYQFSNQPANVSTTERILDSIISTTTIVKFTSVGDRNDMGDTATSYYGRFRISTVSIYDRFSGNLVKDFKFNQSYFGTSQDNNRRMRLDSLLVRGKDTLAVEKYKFVYETQTLPARPSSSGPFYEDYWGYYNGIPNSSMIPYQFAPDTVFGQGTPAIIPSSASGDRSPNHDYAKACMIEEIQYPTGGRTVFEFEPNYAHAAYNYPTGQPYEDGVVGGFRIHRISNYTDSARLVSYKTYNYSLGKTRMIESSLFRYGQRYFYSIPIQVYAHCLWTSDRNIITSNPFLSLTADNGPPVFYEYVTEFDGDTTGLNGKTVYSFITPPSLPPIIDETRFYGSMDLDRGNYSPKPSGSQRFKKKGPQYELVESIGNTYTSYKSQQFNTGIRLVHTTSYPVIGTEYYDYMNSYPGGQCNMLYTTNGAANYYYFFQNTATQEISLLTRKDVYNYGKDTSNKLITTTLYTYDTATHLQPVRQVVFSSAGDSLKTTFKYPIDFAGTAVYDTMIARNIIATAVEQANYKNSTFLKSAKSNYYNWGNYLIAPQTVESKTLTANSEARLRFHAYDVKGNVISVSKENDTKLSYIWDYKDVYPIAQVTNADTGSIAYTSFEADGKGKWFYSGSPNNDLTSPSGKKTYLLNGSNNIARSGLSTSTTYIVSYWTKNSSAYSITGTISNYPVSGRTINGWKYFEHRVTGQSTITISGTGAIDELRLYPVTAEMETYVYDPLIGIRSQCDVNNRIRYYEYDAFQRLVLIRDQDQKIIKRFCYNYSGQAESCFYYYNAVKTGNYTRDNCSFGYVGSTVTYTVPAGKYSSTINQADVDAIAQADVYANGQAYANANGTCQQLISINYTNNNNYQNFVAEFYSSSTGADYFFNVGNGSGTLGYIEPGTYDVFIYNTSDWTNRNFSVCSSNQSGDGGANFYSVVISASCHTISINY